MTKESIRDLEDDVAAARKIHNRNLQIQRESSRPDIEQVFVSSSEKLLLTLEDKLRRARLRAGEILEP